VEALEGTSSCPITASRPAVDCNPFWRLASFLLAHTYQRLNQSGAFPRSTIKGESNSRSSPLAFFSSFPGISLLFSISQHSFASLDLPPFPYSLRYLYILIARILFPCVSGPPHESIHLSCPSLFPRFPFFLFSPHVPLLRFTSLDSQQLSCSTESESDQSRVAYCHSSWVPCEDRP
jgi:hypothetical protein